MQSFDATLYSVIYFNKDGVMMMSWLCIGFVFRWLQNIDEAKMKENQVEESPIAESLYKLDLHKEMSWLR